MRVPTYDNFQVDTGAAPSSRFEAPPNLQTATVQVGAQQVYGEQMQTVGNAMQKSASGMIDLVAEAQKEANALRVQEAMNQAKDSALQLQFDQEKGFNNIRGKDALERQSGKPLAVEYSETLQEQLNSLSEGLGNDAQRRAFGVHSGELLAGFQRQAQIHQATQYREYRQSVNEATLSNSIRSIALGFNDPNVVARAQKEIELVAKNQAQLLGKSPEWADTEARRLMSKGHSLAIDAALERGDAGTANAYLKQHIDTMEADDILKLKDRINKQGSENVVSGAVDRTYNRFAPEFAGSDLNRAMNILWGTESNFRQFDKNGNVIASGKGAIGMSQVMPTTAPEAAKLAGLPWDAELFGRKLTGDPVKDQEAVDYNKALGRAYFTKQLQDFSGNIDQAYAAYNAGPGAVRAALKTAEKQGGSYLDYLPKETQNYVGTNVSAFNSGKGRGVPSQKAIEDSLVAELGPDATPAQVQSAVTQSRQRYNTLLNSQKEQGYQIANTAISALQQNGGNWAALSPSVRDGVPFELVDRVKSYGEKVANGQVRTNPAVYDKLTNPGFLVKLSDAEFGMLRADLDPQDFQQFAQERAALRSGKAQNAAGDVPGEAINTVISTKMRMLGIDPTPKDDDTNGQMRMGAVKQFVRNSVREAQAGLGRKMNETEVEDHVNKLFLRSFNFKNTVLGVPYGNVQSTPYLSMQYGDIPGTDRNQIEDALKARGVAKPTQGDVMSVYLNMKMRNRNG